MLPQISEAEWQVMKVIWDRGDVTAAQVVEALGHTHWRPRTIKTLLGRLVAKGAVEAMPSAGRKSYTYRAKVNQAACIRQESRSFLSRVFDGAVAPAVVHLLSHGRLSPEEIRQLRQVLEQENKP